MKVISIVSIIVLAGIVIASSICVPEYLATNKFLLDFIGNEVLSILAVIMTVTAASGANIHLAFNRAEEAAEHDGLFQHARREINGGVMLLIALFALSVVTLIVRSFLLESMMALSFLNGLVLLFLFINILVLIDLTLTVFEIHPILKKENQQ